MQNGTSFTHRIYSSEESGDKGRAADIVLETILLLGLGPEIQRKNIKVATDFRSLLGEISCPHSPSPLVNGSIFSDDKQCHLSLRL